MSKVVELVVGIALLGTGIGFAVAGVALFGLSAAATALTVITAGANLIIGGAVGMMQKPPSLSSLTQQGNTITVKQAAAPRLHGYGRFVVGGVYTYLATTGTNNEFLHIVVTFLADPADAIEAYFFDQYQLVLSGGDSGNETSKYNGFLSVERKLGAAGEAAFPGLITDTAGLGASAWTSSCRQDGCVSVHFKLKWDQTTWPNGVPVIRAKIRGCKLFDPRTSTTAWSNNWALCVRDWLTDPVNGLKCASTEINDTLLNAAANLSDEAVSLLAGGSESRYTCNGTYDASKTRGTVIAALLTAGAGRLSPIGGQWSLYGGAWRAPALSLSDDDFRAGLLLTAKTSRRDLASGVKGDFIDPNNDWQTNTFSGMVLASYVADDSGFPGTAERGRWATATAYLLNDAVMSNGFAYVCTSGHTSGGTTQPGVGGSWPTVWKIATELNWKTVSYPFTTSASTAQRLSKIDLETGRRQMQLAAPCKLQGYLAQPPEVLQISSTPFAFVNKTFEITQCDLSPESDGAWGADFQLQESDANVYAWSTAFEQAQQPLVAVSVANPGVAVAPGAPGLLSGASTVLLRGDGIKLSRIQVTWIAPADQFVLSGGKIFGEYQLHASGNWQPAFEVDGATTIAFIQGVNDGVSYDVRIRSRNVHDVYSGWAETDNHTVSSTVSYFTGGVIGRSFGKSLLGNGGFESNVAGSPLNTDIAVGGDVTDEWYAHILDSFAPQVDTAAPRSGAHCLVLHALGTTVVPASSTHGSRVFTKMLIPIKQGDIVRVNGYVRADFSGSPNAGISLQAVIGFYLIAADGVTLLQEQFAIQSGITGAIGYTKLDASLQVPVTAGGQSPAYIRAQCTAFVVNANGSPTAIGHDCAIRFDDITAVLQATAFDLTPVNTASTIIGGVSPLTQHGTASTQIDVVGFTLQFADGQISYSGGSVDPGSFGTWNVYFDDPTFSGGTVTFQATSVGSNTIAANGRVYIGTITTVSGSIATGTGGGTGGGGVKGKGALTP